MRLLLTECRAGVVSCRQLGVLSGWFVCYVCLFNFKFTNVFAVCATFDAGGHRFVENYLSKREIVDLHIGKAVFFHAVAYLLVSLRVLHGG